MKGELVHAESHEGRKVGQFDAIVVGGGPGGLSAALVLGRACRKVLVCDAGPGRNARAVGVHGFFSQDGTSPTELRRIGREQLKTYDVTFRSTTVTDARQVSAGFEVTLQDGQRFVCRKLILATGIVDQLPELSGLREIWGTTAILCPYCHGWEYRGKPWAFLSPPEHLIESATLLMGWTRKLTYLTNERATIADAERKWLQDHAITIVENRIKHLESSEGELSAVRFDDGSASDCTILKLHLPIRQRSPFAEKLGCEIIKSGIGEGMVKTEPTGETNVEGLYVVGDASAGAPSVAFAVSDGAMAAGVANRAMLIEDAQ